MQKKVRETAVWGFFAGAFIVLVIANMLWRNHIIDSDYATQLLLSKICSEEKRILTDSWIYGNEIRFLNTQIIYGLVFLFTGDWSVVRTIGNIILYLLMSGTYFYMMKPLKISGRYKLLGAGVLMIPYSIVALSIIYMSADYLPPICIMFLVLGALLRSMESLDKKDRKDAIKKIAILSIFLLLAGMNGFRSALVIAGPLCLIGFYRLAVRTKKGAEKEIYVWIASGISFMIGLGVNLLIFMPKYGFNSQNGLSFADIGNGILTENLEACLRAFLGALGFAPASVFSLHGIINMVVLFFAVAAVYMVGRNLRSGRDDFLEEILVQFLAGSLVFNFLFYGFTDGRMLIPRYVIHVNSILIPVLVICMYRENCRIKKYILAAAMVCFWGIGAMRTYYSLVINDYNADRYASIQYLEDNHLEFGYATPWNAGVIMELTDGEIEVVNMENIEEGIPDRVTCPKRWFTDPYEGTSFLLLTREEYDDRGGTLSLDNPAYEDEKFLIFVYQSAGDICNFRM